jgi:ATP phosphoribosyltransferase
VLSLVLPKGSLEKQVLELFSGADLAVIRGGDRDYAARVDDPRIDRVRFLRPQEIPTYVEQGIFDLGISGRDWVTETAADRRRPGRRGSRQRRPRRAQGVAVEQRP